MLVLRNTCFVARAATRLLFNWPSAPPPREKSQGNGGFLHIHTVLFSPPGPEAAEKPAQTAGEDADHLQPQTAPENHQRHG